MEVKNPAWVHETLTLNIGDHAYEFKTLSLYDVWTMWPLLATCQQASVSGRPLLMIESAKQVLRYLCPVLAANEADMFKASEIHANFILDFYRLKHDWDRVRIFGEKTAAAEQAPDIDRDKAHETFIWVCANAAKYANMPVDEFVKMRFEFCADQIMAAKRAMGEKEKEDEPEDWSEFLMNTGLKLGGKSIIYGRPTWADALEGKVAGNG